MEKVKCAECGFLALRNIYNRQLVEADCEYREELTLPKSIEKEVPECELSPLCFVRKCDLRKEATRIARSRGSRSVTNLAQGLGNVAAHHALLIL